MLHTHKTQCTTCLNQNEQIGKTCIGRRTDGDQNIAQTDLSRTTNIKTLKMKSRQQWKMKMDDKNRPNDCEESNSGNQKTNGRDEYVQSR